MVKILEIGPSPTRSKGGMATVIKAIQKSPHLKDDFEIEVFDSYIDGMAIKRLLYMSYALLRFFFTKRHYDLYHIHMAAKGSVYRKCLYIAMIRRWHKKIIVHIHGSQMMAFLEGLSETRKKKLEGYLRSVDLVLVLSKYWQEGISNLLNLTNCQVLCNGIDEQRYQSCICQANDFMVLGRLGHRKGTYLLLDAISQVAKTNSQFKVYLAGDGDIHQVQDQIRKLGLEKQVLVLGWLSDQEKLDLFNRVSTLILPSYHEGLPMAILEAMAAGKLILSTKVGAIPEVLDQTSNILIEAGHLEALVQAIQFVLSLNEVQLATIGQENRTRISQQYSQTKIHHMLADYYHLVLERKK